MKDNIMPTAKLKAVPKAPTLGDIIDSYWTLREQKRVLDAQTSAIEKDLEEMKERVIELMNDAGIDSVKGKKASVSFGKPMISFSFDLDNDGFEDFTKFVKKNNYFHLFQRRLSDPACREILESKGAIPGLKTFTKRTLTLKTVA